MADDKLIIATDLVRDVEKLTKRNSQPITTETVHSLVIPNDCKLESLLAYQFPDGRPKDRIIQHPIFRDAVSFCRYYSLFQDDRSRVFGDPVQHSFVAVLDYHGTGGPGVRKPEFLSHQASFKMELDDRWKVWSEKSGKVFSQADFAEFVEDNNSDISDPSGAHMLEVARDLKASIGANFESKVTPKNGQVQMRYTETIDGKVGTGDVEVPEFFKLSIPVFYGEEPTTITARLRYRITGGQLTFHYKMYRQAEILNDAFNKASGSIADTLKIDVLIGSIT